MKVYSTPDIRNLALIGHGGAGKTSLTSGLLFASGAVNRLGKVEEGTSITDFDEEEIERKISLQTALAHVEWKNTKLNLIDTPGYAAFVADAKVALAAADTALLLVEAVSGVQVITERTFAYAKDFDLPVMFVMSKLDRENASYERTLESIQDRFGREAVPVQLPIGAEHDFAGVVDLIGMKAFRFAQDDPGKMTAGEIPADLADQAAEMRSALVEMVAENDESLMEAFFDAGDLTGEQLLSGLRNAVAGRKLMPVYCTSGTHLIGLQPLMDAIVDIAPAPDARGEAVGTVPGEETEVRRPVAADQPVSLFVFKTIADPFAGKLSMFRVCSGTLTGDSNVVNVNRENFHERLGGISVMQGKQTETVKEMQAGDLGVVAKLKETQTSDTLCDPGKPILYSPVKFREPAISYAVEPKSKGDEEKISTALVRLMEEDPVLRVRRDPQTGELLVSGTGQVHVEVALAKMKRKFGVDAILHPPRVPYQETIRKKVGGVEGKHKKQSGGRGQFGVCVIDMEPLPRGSGFEFVDKIFGGSIPQNYRPAVEKGIREAANRGWLSDSPVVDFRVTLIDGKYHSVDSSEMAFKIAGSLAFQAAMDQAKPVILEPIMSVEITAPEDCMGDIMGDLSQRRGKPQGMDAQGAYQLIKAQVPMSEMLEYASTLKSVTSDRGSYQMEFSHYEEVPGQIQEKIVAEAKKRKEEKAG
jgi:elongation factor G